MPCRQQRAHGWLVDEGHIGVPVVVVGRVVVIGVQHDDFHRVRMRGVHRVDMQLAKAPRQIALLHGGDGLVLKEQHMVLEQPGQQCIALLVSHGLGQVNAGDEGANGRAQGLDVQGHGGGKR